MSEKVPNEELLRRKRVVEGFLKDEIIKQALLDLEADNYVFFTNASTSDLRVTAWAKAQALAAFSTELLRVVGAGQRAAAEIENATKRDSRTPQR
jgi:hypothetical protein